MHIEHVALWTNDLERCVEFYRQYFGATPGARYVNSKKGFESTFLQFSSGARLEVMKRETGKFRATSELRNEVERERQ